MRPECSTRSNNPFIVLAAFLLIVVGNGWTQVVSPSDIKDAGLRELQTRYLDDLRSVGEEVVKLRPEYPFYLNRKLGLEEAQQKSADQHSIRFDQFNGQTVLAITGNYYASYSTKEVSPERRARETTLNLVLPILRAAVPRFQNNHDVQGYAVEVAHHVRGKVMDVSMERSENLFAFFPQKAAIRLLAAKDDTAEQAALLDSQFLLNGDAVTIWLEGQEEKAAAKRTLDADKPKDDPADANAANSAKVPPAAIPPTQPKEVPARDTSTAAVASLQAVNQSMIDAIARQLDPQAHLVAYAPPSFVVFRQEIYLQFSMNTSLPDTAGASRYKVAAMAFDDHIAHLIRPLMAFFKVEQQFDGVDFSTSVHLANKPSSNAPSVSVEFFFPFSAMHCYERYECTGHQLIDAGTVLINGERVGLNLEIAESGVAR